MVSMIWEAVCDIYSEYMMRNAAGDITFIGSFTTDLPELNLPEVAVVGRSNVGKSSLLNKMLNKKKAARVSSTPGRTQAVNLFKVGESLVVADLPGYGFARAPDEIKKHWGKMIYTYLSERERLALVIVLVDARRDALASDGEMIKTLCELEVPILVVATKVDKLKKSQRGRQLKVIRVGHDLSVEQLLPFSSMTGEGRNELWDVIEATLAAPNS